MSSWLSLNPFKSPQEPQQNPSENHPQDQLSPSHGSVKEDLSELGKTLSKQLWGVASFLAPPPPSSFSAVDGDEKDDDSSDSQTLVGIRNDFAEISGSLKSGFSLISTNKAVNEISRLASNILQFGEEGGEEEDSSSDDDSDVVGVTDEVLEFVGEISLRPECWIDFPLSLDDYDFDMSNVQKEHVSAVEHLSPILVDLRMKLCPSRMREEHFWMIYFILLHPRLNKDDSELLSTSQIMEARDILLKTMQTRKKAHSQTPKADDKDGSNNVQLEQNVVQEKEALPKTENAEHQEDADVDQWLEEEDVTGPGPSTSYTGPTHLGNEQDVSFSDLEDDDDSDRLGGTEKPNDSPGWVQLSENSDNGGVGKKKTLRGGKDSEGEEWLTVDEFDSDK